MVIPNVRTAAWSALKQRLRFRKGEEGYIKKKNNRTVIEMEMSRAFVGVK